MADSSAPTRVMMAVNESSLKGYPHPSISCRSAFDWMAPKLVRSNTDGFHLLFLHVQVPDEDGARRNAPVPSRSAQGGGGGVALIKCEAWTKHGDPKEVICHEVKRVQPDLLVVGSRGLGPFQRTWGNSQQFFVLKFVLITLENVPLIKRRDDLTSYSYRTNRTPSSKELIMPLPMMVFVGTVSEFCVKHAECPVITIKRKANEAPQDPIDD
uniref:UspA domain-containing protein n=1 Tax=Aegilops tauschii TaxID=37682 RepID=R7WAW6_AEGTA